MKKIFILSFLALFCLSLVLAEDVNLENKIPTEALIGAETKGFITVSQTNLVKLDVSLVLPVDSEFVSWKIVGNDSPVAMEKFVTSFSGKDQLFVHWNISGPLDKAIYIDYSIRPLTLGDREVKVLWVSPSGIGTKESSIKVVESLTGEEVVSVSSCGNWICEFSLGETIKGCPQDCLFSFQQYPKFWIGFAAVIVGIVLIGIAYRVYKNFKENPHKAVHKQVEHRPVVHAKKGKAVRESVKKKSEKPVAVKSSGRKTEFYSDTIKRLEAIRKSLK